VRGSRDDDDGNDDEKEEKSASSGRGGQDHRSTDAIFPPCETHVPKGNWQTPRRDVSANRLSGSRLVTVAKVLGTSVEQIVGSNGNSKDNGPGEYLTALSEPSVIALVRMLERLPRSKQREAARAITDLITAILGAVNNFAPDYEAADLRRGIEKVSKADTED
jgi:hypothetical protein